MNFWQTLPKPFTILAPMEGVTDVVFRQLIAETARPDVFFTEFTNVDGLTSPNNKIAQRLLLYTHNQHPIVAQIWGTDPEKFYQAGLKIAQMGFDGIDINLGCPVRKVVKKGACAAMIGKYEPVAQIIQAVKKSAPNLPVSVKTRLGFDHIITTDWVTFLLEQKLQALTVHGRIAKQLSKGIADWDEIGKAVLILNKISPQTKIIGNGDIQSYENAVKMHQTYGVDGVMIGRGVFDNPWIFDHQQKSHTSKDYLNLLKRHLQLFDSTYGSAGHFEVLKRFFKVYIRDFPGSKELRLKLMSATSISQALDLISRGGGN